MLLNNCGFVRILESASSDIKLTKSLIGTDKDTFNNSKDNVGCVRHNSEN